MEIQNIALEIVPPRQARQHDDTESRGHYRATLRNRGDQTESVRLVYSLETVDGRGEHEEIALAVEPGQSRDWEVWLSLWSRYERPETVELRARLQVAERDYEITRSFQVEAGERPRSEDPARVNMPAGGSRRGEV